MRRFSTPLRFTRLVIATHNPGKLREFAAMLDAHIKDANVKDAYVKNVVSAGELGLPEPEETGTTFAENAILKAQAAAKASGSIALADDSGLCVNALNGDPGIYSARWGGPNKDFAAAMQRVHDALGDASPEKTGDRSAYFICVLALAGPDGELELFEGRLDGAIIWPPRGDQGHGYDPFFVPTGHDKTCAEMDSAEKNAISHRGIALRKLLARLSHA